MDAHPQSSEGVGRGHRVGAPLLRLVGRAGIGHAVTDQDDGLLVVRRVAVVRVVLPRPLEGHGGVGPPGRRVVQAGRLEAGPGAGQLGPAVAEGCHVLVDGRVDGLAHPAPVPVDPCVADGLRQVVVEGDERQAVAINSSAVDQPEEGEVGVVNKMSVKNGNIGDVGRLEVVITESGKGEQIISDNIIGTALSTLKTTAGLLRYRAKDWQIPEEIFSDYDIYIHSPIHEVTHDGSSGGIADVICILSAIKNLPVPHTIAITGAITLKGRVMRIGGVKAKVLAAQRHKMKTIILPLGNKKDVDELPPDVVGNMEFKYFEDMVDVYDYIFGGTRA